MINLKQVYGLTLVGLIDYAKHTHKHNHCMQTVLITSTQVPLHECHRLLLIESMENFKLRNPNEFNRISFATPIRSIGKKKTTRARPSIFFFSIDKMRLKKQLSDLIDML